MVPLQEEKQALALDVKQTMQHFLNDLKSMSHYITNSIVRKKDEDIASFDSMLQEALRISINAGITSSSLKHARAINFQSKEDRENWKYASNI